MKKLVILVCSIILMSCSVSESSSGVENQSEEENTLITEEVKTAIEELLPVKAIEKELVFGYSIEDVRLMDNLEQGRNIRYVIEHFDKYYEDEVLEKYLYYLKRSTTQTFYKEIGVFWGDSYSVVGNVYKREAKSISYDIKYIDIQERKGSLEVKVEITPIYHGDYNVRGLKSDNYRSEKEIVTLHLSEGMNGEYRLMQLSDDVLLKMEEEIGEKIDLHKEKKDLNYPELEILKYESDSQKEGFYFAYDILKRFEKGRLNSIYDQYNQIWIHLDREKLLKYENHLEYLMNRELSPDFLKEDYGAWDYAFLLEDSPDKWKSRSSRLMAFNVDNGDIWKLAFIDNTEVIDEFLLNYESEVENIKSYVNNEINLVLNLDEDSFTNKSSLLEYTNRYYDKLYSGEVEGISITNSEENAWTNTIYGKINTELVDQQRKVDTLKIAQWKVEENGEEYSLVYPPSGREKNYFTTSLICLYCYDSCDNELSYQIGPIRLVIGTEYLYPEINLYIYDSKNLDIKRESVDHEWKLFRFHDEIYTRWTEPKYFYVWEVDYE